MKKRILASLIFALVFCLPDFCWAVKADFSGYYRVMGDYFRKRDLKETGPSAYFIHRLRLNPTFTLTELISIRTQWDILDNVVWGFNKNGTSNEEGENSEEDEIHTLSQQTDNYDLNREIVVDLKVKRVWGELVTPVGILKFGRMPVHWGMGIFFNDGDCPECFYGDTADRLSFATKLGPIYTTLMYSKITEGPIHTDDPSVNPDGDANEWSLALLHKKAAGKVGMYWTNRIQRSSNTYFYVFDLYSSWTLGPFDLEGEILTLQGRTRMPKLFNQDYKVAFKQWGWVARASYGWSMFKVGLEYGLATGPGRNEYNLKDPTNPENSGGNQLNRLTFDRDYNVDLILFEEVMAYYDPFNNSPEEDNPGGGAISNAWYLRPCFSIKYGRLSSGAALLYADMLKSFPAIDGDRDLGIEVDIYTGFRAYENIEFLIESGYLIAGDAAGNIRGKKSNAFTLQGRILVRF